MIVTTAWMDEWFERLNRQCFQGTLPKPRLVLSRARTRLGRCQYKRLPGREHDRARDFTIALTTYYDMEERAACNVLLHEMIHYHIALHRLPDTGPHGRVFRQIVRSLNNQWGWEVSVRTNVEGWKTTSPEKERQELHLVLAVETSHEECFLSVVAPSYARALEARIRKAREVIRHSWYTSRDTYFNGFPKVRSLRGRKVSKETLLKVTSTCQPIDLQVG